MIRPVSRSRLIPFAAALMVLGACAGGPPTDGGPASAVPEASPEPAVAPADLIGMASGELEQALGLPGLKRTDPPAEIWQYTRATCTVNVFLYNNGKDTPHRVEHIEAVDKAGAAMDAARCLGGGA